MYVPTHFSVDDETELFRFIDNYGFATIITPDLEFSQAPLIHETKSGTHKLKGHIARSNPHGATIDGQEVLIIFNGPHAYISPSWYSKGPGVPTWNYATVEVKGKLKLVGKNETLDSLESTVNKFEPSLLNDEKTMPTAFIDKLVDHILGFEISISSVKGKYKLSQNKPLAEQERLLNRLSSIDHHEARNLSDFWKEQLGA